MDKTRFRNIYNQSRNGANYFVRHPLARKFQYSDGIQDLAETGCYWLVDIIATEVPQALQNAGEYGGLIKVDVVEGNKATIQLTTHDYKPAIWEKKIEFTDIPLGEWIFEVADEGAYTSMILLSEH